jgi:membrane-associated protease RseP (regulator of RpoE activity)
MVWAVVLCLAHIVMAVHEGAHLVAARLSGVPTVVFQIGGGPTLASFSDGMTTFRIKAWPTEAFCNAGYTSKTIHKAAGIAAAGPVASVAFGVLCILTARHYQKRAGVSDVIAGQAATNILFAKLPGGYLSLLTSLLGFAARISVKAHFAGFYVLLGILGWSSLLLGAANALPILPMDGGITASILRSGTLPSSVLASSPDSAPPVFAWINVFWIWLAITGVNDLIAAVKMEASLWKARQQPPEWVKDNF